ncbi:hypothetical protein C8R44DRAFT_865473 [Mycena epipterygia]|nr:hypothetical protein C8R44DRAFT_865473 [Mycena epipterygia]
MATAPALPHWNYDPVELPLLGLLLRARFWPAARTCSHWSSFPQRRGSKSTRREPRGVQTFAISWFPSESLHARVVPVSHAPRTRASAISSPPSTSIPAFRHSGPRQALQHKFASHEGAHTTPDSDEAHLTVAAWKTVLALLPALEAVRLHIDDGGMRFCDAVLETGHPAFLRSIQLILFTRLGPDETTVDPFLNVLKCLLNATDNSPCHRLF